MKQAEGGLAHLAPVMEPCVKQGSLHEVVEAVDESGWTVVRCRCCGKTLEKRRSWAAWKAAMLNQLFLEQGRMGEPGRITEETCRKGQK
ncbi:MAG: hypothetical protein C5B60_00095 [Chloroflexi bacterium]|nr:MAG: hypothetical protein C5B60_00095 [Chloroflexota bacterium]